MDGRRVGHDSWHVATSNRFGARTHEARGSHEAGNKRQAQEKSGFRNPRLRGPKAGPKAVASERRRRDAPRGEINLRVSCNRRQCYLHDRRDKMPLIHVVALRFREDLTEEQIIQHFLTEVSRAREADLARASGGIPRHRLRLRDSNDGARCILPAVACSFSFRSLRGAAVKRGRFDPCAAAALW